MNEDQQWTSVCSFADIRDESGHYVEINNRPLAVFRIGEKIHVMDDACPHAGAPLSAGTVDANDGCVVCALHAWAFRLEDGICPDNQAISVRVYPSRVVDGVVQAQL